jgi:hypothetical protein
MNNAKFLGIESSDGEPCDCCGTACPRRRVVIENESGIRRLGSTCASLALRPRDVAKIQSESAVHDRQERAIAAARKHLSGGMTLAAVRNRLGCFVRTDIRDGVVIAIRQICGQWVETPITA